MTTYFFPDPKKFSTPKLDKGLKKKPKEPTGELALFKQIYKERKGKCEITGDPIDFHPRSFHHILEKGQNKYPDFKLYKKNIIMVIPEIHDMIHNSTKSKLLQKHPKAQVIFDRHEVLLIEYNNRQTV